MNSIRFVIIIICEIYFADRKPKTDNGLTCGLPVVCEVISNGLQ